MKIVVDYLVSFGFTVGIVGSDPRQQSTIYNSGNSEQLLIDHTDLIDLRGRTSLMELAGALSLSKAFLTVDAGPLHISAAVGTLTLAVVGNDSTNTGASPLRLWLPRVPNVHRTIASHSCSLCSDNRFQNDGCLVSDHPCMSSVTPNQVIEWLNINLVHP